MWDICRCCDGDCCKTFPLVYKKNKKTVYKNNPYIPSFIHKKGKYFVCDIWNETTGKCNDYENRPFFCRDFICNKAVDILMLVSENPFPIVRGI